MTEGFQLGARLRSAWARARGVTPARLGIASWLAVAIIAVTVLVLVANAITHGKLAVLRVFETRREHADPVVLPPVHLPPVAKTVTPAPVAVPFPSAEPLLRALERIDSAVDASADTESADVGVSARYPKLTAELDHTAAVFASSAKAAGESPPSRFMPTVRSYAQQGGELIKLAEARRESMDDYSSHFEQLNARVKKALDQAWNIFGRVVARQSLVKLTSNLDELRRRYAEVVSADTVDSSTFDALGASEEALAKTLIQDRGGLTRSDGKDWYAKSLEDLQAMAATRKSLQQIDRQRKEG
ncbi:MAG: hypothetical protein JO042_05745, partial [Sinobacteraceae bacterium]|nr:hypothetical protein [Nevskiaceae bacterium]